MGAPCPQHAAALRPNPPRWAHLHLVQAALEALGALDDLLPQPLVLLAGVHKLKLLRLHLLRQLGHLFKGPRGRAGRRGGC